MWVSSASDSHPTAITLETPGHHQTRMKSASSRNSGWGISLGQALTRLDVSGMVTQRTTEPKVRGSNPSSRAFVI